MRHWYNLRQVLIVALAFFLAACASQTVRNSVPDPQAAWSARQDQLQAVQSWEMQGRLAVHAGKEGGQMALQWQHSPRQDEIDGLGPLGKRLFELTQDAHGATLQDDKQRRYYADDAQTLLVKFTGWRLPVAQLYRWLLGLPLVGSPEHHELDSAGRLARLQQLGWEIHYLDYARYGDYVLPRKLLLRSLPIVEEGRPSLIELRFVIQQWVIK